MVSKNNNCGSGDSGGGGEQRDDAEVQSKEYASWNEGMQEERQERTAGLGEMRVSGVLRREPELRERDSGKSESRFIF
jgi:hypothetical protein